MQKNGFFHVKKQVFSELKRRSAKTKQQKGLTDCESVSP